jgi:hypothetical protein
VAAALLFPVIVAPVAAVAPPIAYPNVGVCDGDIGGDNYWNGITIRNANFTTVRGIRAKLYKDANIQRCNDTGFDDVNGPSYWVAIVPSPGNPYYGSGQAIIQVGVIWCFEWLYPGALCDDGGEDEPQLFWASGGCGSPIIDAPNPEPFLAQQYNAAPAGGLWFYITYLGSGDYLLEIESDSGFHAQRTVSGGATDCWAANSGTTHPVRAAVYCERLDAGDACGGAGTGGHVAARGVKIKKSVGGAWYYPGEFGYGLPITEEQCAGSLSDSYCDVLYVDGWDMWDVN